MYTPMHHVNMAMASYEMATGLLIDGIAKSNASNQVTNV